ncbi:hypothetical protein [Acidocella sp. MX-AZ02]|uniref:hypothetical protein n=1 Tax=Acidocella sp. MX-AZ02 TaxID=1214225 RepID=UPI00028D79D3|nr:hypothetical protein [Acidocella sp. MX-AZ02]EKM99504.1 hypothetical protein MXAZACID_09938 [Acidocella sp. MX-AZ02]
MADPYIFDQLLGIANAALSSPLFIAIVSTAIAAFAGTWGAQLLAERTARRKEILAEIRGVNAALSFAFNIANTYIATKKQLTKELVAGYKQQRADREAHDMRVNALVIPANTTFTYQLVLQTILPPYSPIAELQKILLDRINPSGRALLLLTPLMQSIEGFADAAAQRNAWIDEVKKMPENNDAMKACLYFGTPFAPGRVDDRYPNLMDAIERYNDSCIGFSVQLVNVLREHGEKMAAEYGKDAPKISKPDFKMAGDLIPDLKEYARWVEEPKA